jgi:serine phosphatase RsbU (regulator of sigma subunit)
MTTFFWVAEIANFVTTVTAFAALLIVLWLGPRRWTNLSFACFLTAMILWMAPSVILRLLVNFPEMGGDWQLLMNIIGFGFAVLGIAMFWFIESFYPLPRRWRWAANLMGLAVYGLFMVLLVQNKVVNQTRLGEDGGIAFTITPIGRALSAFHFVYDALALGILIRHAVWRERWHLMVGAIIVVVTTVLAQIFVGIAVQTYTIAIGTLFMAYEVVKQQLFNPLLTMNQRLEAEVEARTGELKQSLAEQERVKSELAIAREIQESLLPRATPDLPHIAIAGRSLPALEVGGDFYTYHMFADGRLGIAVGDVSGKGVPAALLMALSLRTFEMLIEQHSDQGDLLNAFNTALAPGMAQSNQNTAFLIIVVDRDGRSAAICNAGLIAPLLWRDGEVRYVESFGLPLGAMRSSNYRESRVELQPGDRILMVSDGIVEAMNSQREMWGFERLEQTFREVGGAGPAAIIASILGRLEGFTEQAPQHDDMTMVTLQVL